MQSWSALGATVALPELTEIVRHAAQPKMVFDQVCAPPLGKALGRSSGDRIDYDFFPNVTKQGGILSELEETPVASITPVKVYYNVYERGNSLKWTGSLELLSQLELEDNFTQSLLNDYAKTMNQAAHDVADDTHWKFSPDSTIGSSTFVQNNTLVHTTSTDLNWTNLGRLVKNARKYNIPYFDGESYVLIVGVDTEEALESDTTIHDKLRYDSGRAALNGELGRVRTCRIVVDNHAIVNQPSVAFNEAFLLGTDSLGSDFAAPIEIRRDVKDFARQIGVGWFSTEARYKILNQTSHGQENIIHVSSQ
jgi:hypothetical protein